MFLSLNLHSGKCFQNSISYQRSTKLTRFFVDFICKIGFEHVKCVKYTFLLFWSVYTFMHFCKASRCNQPTTPLLLIVLYFLTWQEVWDLGWYWFSGLSSTRLTLLRLSASSVLSRWLLQLQPSSSLSIKKKKECYQLVCPVGRKAKLTLKAPSPVHAT